MCQICSRIFGNELKEVVFVMILFVSPHHDYCTPPTLAFTSTYLEREESWRPGFLSVSNKNNFVRKLKMLMGKLIRFLAVILLFSSIYFLLWLEDSKNTFCHVVSVIIKQAAEISH